MVSGNDAILQTRELFGASKYEWKCLLLPKIYFSLWVKDFLFHFFPYNFFMSRKCYLQSYDYRVISQSVFIVRICNCFMLQYTLRQKIQKKINHFEIPIRNLQVIHLINRMKHELAFQKRAIKWRRQVYSMSKGTWHPGNMISTLNLKPFQQN